MAKIRHGFVSNSSSSSFVITFPKDVEITTETVLEHVTMGSSPSSWDGSNYLTSEQAAEIVAKDMQEAGVATDATLKETLHCLSDYPAYLTELADNRPDYEEVVYGSRDWNKQNHQMSLEERNAKWEEYDRLHGEWVELVIDKIKANSASSGCDIYVVEYDDGFTVGSIMEHGGTFDRAIHAGSVIRVSNH